MRRNDQAAGRIVFSVELELAIDRNSVLRQQNLDHITRRLLSLFEQHGLKATWAVADPAHSAATAAITASPLGHEVAVLGEACWLGPGAGRPRMSRELARRVGGARQRGIAVSTLILRDVTAPLDLGLIRDQHISAISYPSNSFSLAGSIPHGPRSGVWHAPAAWRMPLAPCWWQPFGWQLARRLGQASRAERIIHIAIDGNALVDQQERGLAQVAATIEQAARLHRAGKLAVGSMSSHAAEQRSHYTAQSAKSLLSPAA